MNKPPNIYSHYRHKKYFFLFWLFTTFIILLTGCSHPKRPQHVNTLPTLSPQEAFEKNQLILNSIHSWSSKGRLAISKKHEGESASFTWKQTSTQFFLKLFGPFGSGAMELEGVLTGPYKQVVLRHGSQIHYASTAEDLLYQQVKWRIPLSGLTFWVKGVPVPKQAIDDLVLNSDGSISKLTQSGWEITYDKYALFENLSLPTKIHLINKELEVKLVISDWKNLH